MRWFSGLVADCVTVANINLRRAEKEAMSLLAQGKQDAQLLTTLNIDFKSKQARLSAGLCLPKYILKSFLCRKHHRDPDAWRHVLRPRRKRPRRGHQVALQVSVFDDASSAVGFVPVLLIRRSSQ
jgi:hypothetical protein